MISELLQKQLAKEIEYIYGEDVLPNFCEYFFSEILKEDDTNYKAVNMFVAFANKFVYIQLHTLDEMEIAYTKEFRIPYDAYNNWWVKMFNKGEQNVQEGSKDE